MTTITIQILEANGHSAPGKLADAEIQQLPSCSASGEGPEAGAAFRGRDRGSGDAQLARKHTV